MDLEMFNKKDLFLCDLQYSVRHTNTDKFELGETVFLKSNPETPMIVLEITEEKIFTDFSDYPPECVLQYKYASLMNWNEFEINLN